MNVYSSGKIFPPWSLRGVFNNNLFSKLLFLPCSYSPWPVGLQRPHHPTSSIQITSLKQPRDKCTSVCLVHKSHPEQDYCLVK